MWALTETLWKSTSGAANSGNTPYFLAISLKVLFKAHKHFNRNIIYISREHIDNCRLLKKSRALKSTQNL